ncbi:MAG: PEP-CTERM sorting domain-containing protein [Longimicrobiales bacterium]
MPSPMIRGGAVVALLLCAGVAPVAAQFELFNTGWGAGTVLPDGSVDTDWTWSGSSGSGNAFVLSPGSRADFAWMANSSTSKWVYTEDTVNPVAGTFDFSTTFDLTGYDLATVFIEGQWTVDNTAHAIFVNGTSVGFGGFSGEWTVWHEFLLNAANSPFVAGVNTVTFRTQGDGRTDALRVEFTDYGALPTSTVPEPMSVMLLAAGLAGVGVAARRRRRTTIEAEV